MLRILIYTRLQSADKKRNACKLMMKNNNDENNQNNGKKKCKPQIEAMNLYLCQASTCAYAHTHMHTCATIK